MTSNPSDSREPPATPCAALSRGSERPPCESSPDPSRADGTVLGPTTRAWLYVIRVDLKDGTAVHPVSISRAEPDWDSQLDAAVDYFSEAFRHRGIVSVAYAENLHLAGVADPDRVLSWKLFCERLPGGRPLPSS